jgi:predicted permease
MDDLLRDVRLAIKLLWKEKTFSATVLLTLAVCIAANVAIFSLIHTVLLEPLPYRDSGRLVTVYNSYPGAGAVRSGDGTVDFVQRREHVPAFQEVALFQGTGSTVGEAASTERVSSMRVTPSFFPLLGVEAELGRTFTEEEMEPGRAAEVVLTDAYWREHFGGARDAVGRDLRVDGRPYRIVGVLPPSFRLPTNDNVRFFMPISIGPEERDMQNWHNNNFSMMARLAPGATIAQAVAQNQILNDRLIDQWPAPNARQLSHDVGYHTVVVNAQDDLVRDIAPVLYMLWAGVGLVLLIGCVNIANLMLARAQTRVADVATRLALGAPRRRIARQVLTEAVIMGVVGGAVGVGLGALGLQGLMALGAADLPRGAEIGIDGTVLGFTLLLALAAGLAFGSIPMVQLMRGDLAPVFRTEGRSGTASRRAVLVRNGLVTSQVALAFVLLIGAGLMLVSFREALSVNPGFDRKGLLTAFVSLPSAKYPDPDARRRFTDEFVSQVKAIPGVQAAAVASQLPFTGNSSNSVIFPEGYVPASGESLLSPRRSEVGPGYFDALGIKLLAGRTFRESDGPDVPNVLIIDQWLADRYWPNRSPLGARMAFNIAPGQDSTPEDNLATVVGVVAMTKDNDLTAPPGEHVGAYYFSARQRVPGFLNLVVRAAGDPAGLTPAIRQVLGRIDPELPLYGVETMQARIDQSLRSRKVPLVLLGVFAAVALFLAVVGIYGALAYSVAQRTREIGIRMALGSAPQDVFRSVVAQGLRVTGLGLLVGAGASLLLTRFVQSLLFHVQPADPRVMVAVAAVLGLVGLVACLLPARRATAVDPVSALSAV